MNAGEYPEHQASSHRIDEALSEQEEHTQAINEAPEDPFVFASRLVMDISRRGGDPWDPSLMVD